MISASARRTLNSNVDFSFIKAESRKRLFELLDKHEGTKTIIWDDKLIGPFEFVANASLLRQHDATRLFRLSDVKSKVFNEIRTDFMFFFLRKDYQVARYVAELLNRADKVTLAKTSLVMVPYRCANIEKLLEHEKVDLEKLNSIEELDIEFFVLDTDILSMENEFVYRDLHVNEDRSFAHQVAQGLIKLQDIFGQIPRISGQGLGAKLVCDLLLRHRKLHPLEQDGPQTMRPPQIHQLILIDRRIDLVTPFLTQLTYEGLLDEIFGVNHGTITLSGEKFAQYEEQKQVSAEQKHQVPDETRRFELRSSEELFAKLRDCHINAVADALKQSAKNLQAEYEACSSEGKTIPEIGKIVKRLSNLKVAKKSQSNHVTIAELVNEQTLKAEFIYGLRIEHELLQDDRLNRIVPGIDAKLLRQESSLHLLRLICLQSIISNGFKAKIGDYYKREIIQNYGCDYIPYLLLLEKAHLLLSHEKYYDLGSFNQLRNKFNLILDDVNECNPTHLSYVYGGYSPLSIIVAKLFAQSAAQNTTLNWRSLSDNLKLLPKPTVNHVDQLAANNQNQNSPAPSSAGTNSAISGSYGEAASSLTNNAIAAASLLISAGVSSTGLRVRRNLETSSLASSSSEEARTVLVFFIGGCTFAEISALRFLTQQEDNNCEFLIGTSKIINGKSFLRSLWPHAEAPKG